MLNMPGSPTLIVDTASLYFRAYYGVSASLVDDSGRPVNAVYGLLEMLTRLIGAYSPAVLVCAWDDDWRPAWRVELVPSYKLHRVATPEVFAGQAAEVVAEGGSCDLEVVEDDLAAQVPWIFDCLTAVGLCVVGAPDHEADDVIGTLARTTAAAGGEVVVVTGDRDLFQLVGDHVKVAYVARGVARHELVDDDWLRLKYGVVGRQYADFATLRGDASDGLPGVPGVGEKTAATLLNAYGDLDGVLAAAADPASGLPLRQRLRLTAADDYLLRARLVVATAQLDLPALDAELRPGRADLARCDELAQRHNVTGPMTRLLSVLGEIPH